MLRLRKLIDDLNASLYNPVGLNILYPRDVAFLYVRPDFMLTEEELSDELMNVCLFVVCRPVERNVTLHLSFHSAYPYPYPYPF